MSEATSWGKKKSQHSSLKHLEMESLAAVGGQSRYHFLRWGTGTMVFSLFQSLVCRKDVAQNAVRSHEWGTGHSLSPRKPKSEVTSWATVLPDGLLVPSRKTEAPLPVWEWYESPCETKFPSFFFLSLKNFNWRVNWKTTYFYIYMYILTTQWLSDAFFFSFFQNLSLTTEVVDGQTRGWKSS